MTKIRLPGLVDIHTHMRQPGAEHKETWDTGTAAALAGGFTTVLAMPNTTPAVTDEASLDMVLDVAADGAHCDYAHFLGAGPGNTEAVGKLAGRAAGLKMYLNETFGDLRLDDERLWTAHLERWPQDAVVAVHAEGRSLETVIGLAASMERAIHICHVAGAADIAAIAGAKERSVAVSCEVTPHHLFLDQTTDLPPGRAEVRPRLGTPDDRRALWHHLDVIDCFATDHAPHTLAEKDGTDPPPGFPGLETALPLLLTAVHDGWLTLNDVIERLHVRPIELFELPADHDTWIEVDVDEGFEIAASGHSRSGWTPFVGTPVRGLVTTVVIRGVTAFERGRVVAAAGTGRDLRSEGRRAE